MAAWLAYLKARLVLPQEKGPDGEPTADEMATRLRWRLQRLDAMRAAATRLMGRERLGRGRPPPPAGWAGKGGTAASSAAAIPSRSMSCACARTKTRSTTC